MNTTLKYFVYKLTHDDGQTCCKTAATSKKSAVHNIMMFENCPERAIDIKETPKEFWHVSAKRLFNRL